MTAAKREYLVWDADFAPRFAVSLAVLVAAIAVAMKVPALELLAWEAYQAVNLRLMESAHRLAWWSVIGLLSSSCCALQLMLNALNFGCAGFNTVLGPVRPMLCAITVVLQGAVWMTAWDKPFQWIYVAPGTLVALGLTFLPEILASRRRASKGGVVIAIDGMGCTACATKVTAILAEKRVDGELVFDEKVAHVRAEPEKIQEVCSAITAAGFPASVKSATAPRPAAGTDDAALVSAASPGASCCGGKYGFRLAVYSGLAGSSCCALQLLVNALAALDLLHVGCAGFNKVLGPIRTPLRVLTGLWLAYSWVRALRVARGAVPRLVFQTLVCVFLTFLPEALVAAGGPGAGVAPPSAGAQVLALKVEGMGCEACQHHVQGVMDRAGGVVSSHVDFARGEASLVVQKDWNFDFGALAAKLEYDGYTATLAEPSAARSDPPRAPQATV